MNTKRNLEYWVIPPEANAEFAAHMETDVPVLCMDEQPVQLLAARFDSHPEDESRLGR